MKDLQKEINIAIRNGDIQAVESLLKDGADANDKDIDGRTPLHYAVSNGHINMVKILLKNGADITQVTNKYNTSLHIATSRGYTEIVEILLQHISRNELNDVVNAKTTSGTTSLHVAAKNGSLEIVKCLLKHGATYNIENKEGKTPIKLSKDLNVAEFLELVEEFFNDIENGNVEVISKLRAVKCDEFSAITNAQGYTLLQLASARANERKNIASKLLEMLEEPDTVESPSSPEFNLDQLKSLKCAAEVYINFSKIYLPMLRGMSEPYELGLNFKYFTNAYNLVKQYRDYAPGLIDNENIKSVNDMLVSVECNPSGYSVVDEAIYFFSKGQGTNEQTEFQNYVRSFSEMAELNIDIPIRNFLDLINEKLVSAIFKNLIDAIKNNNLLAVENCITNGVIVNSKDADGRTPLHHAVHNGNIDIISTLLKNGAKVTQTTSKDNTPLLIASLKGHREVVEVLLQYVSCDELYDFINARTTSGGTTSLHVAAKNGFLEVVKSLLKYGATYNVKNKEGKTPVKLSEDQKVIDFLELVEELFRNIENGNIGVISKLRALKPDDFSAITNARNNQGHTLLKVAIANKHKNIESELLEMLNEPDPVESLRSTEFGLYKLESLKDAAVMHIRFSKIYLRMLRNISEPCGSEKNPFPWKTVKEGSYYLENAYNLVQKYRDYVPGSIDNENIKSINDVLVLLEFDPKHITSGYTDEAYGGTAECFVSKGQGSKYYELLHSEFKKDVRSFTEMVEVNIDIPVRIFLDSINEKLVSDIFKNLIDAIKNDNLSAVETCITNGVIVNSKDAYRRTPLHYAVYNGNIDIVSTLLKNGAEVTQTTNKDNTPLHIASLKGHREIVEELLQYVRRDEFYDFINARTTPGGTTSLHVAAENGFLEVVKSLLKHGATYNIENKEGKTAVKLSKDQKVVDFLELCEEFFSDIEKGNGRCGKLRALKPDDFSAITNARNSQGNTLRQVARANFQLLKKPDPVEPLSSPEFRWEQLESVKYAGEVHIRFSEKHLSKLRGMSGPYGSEKNPMPWKTLKEGSYYLGNAYNLVEKYRDHYGSIDNENIKTVNDMLVSLEFDPKHIPKFTYRGRTEVFVSKGLGTKYYQLLHSELKKDVRSFIEKVDLNIDVPVNKFLDSINEKLTSAATNEWIDAITVKSYHGSSTE